MGALPEIWRCCKARGRRISLVDLRLTSNAAAATKIGNPEGCFLAGARRRCSSITERCGYAPSSRLASRPPENSAPVPHFVIGSYSVYISSRLVPCCVSSHREPCWTTNRRQGFFFSSASLTDKSWYLFFVFISEAA